MNQNYIFEFLEEKARQFNTPEYIETDPIQVPHQFSDTNNIEIAGFLTATIAWGNRKSIIKNAMQLMNLMEMQPYEFILNASEQELSRLNNFKHRTFNGIDCKFFIKSLRNIYKNHKGLKTVFEENAKGETNIEKALINFRNIFFEIEHPERSTKHVANVLKNSSAKRLNMFLRWMVRNDGIVDFGIWKGIKPSQLLIPLDVHCGNVARKLGILKRKQNDWKAVNELMNILIDCDPEDPVKYDYALFGLGVFEKF